MTNKHETAPLDTSGGTRGIMVCVTGQRSCERLIAHGAAIRKEDCKLFVVHCVQTGHPFMGSKHEADAIEYLFTAARLIGAELTVLREDSVIDALVAFAQKNNVCKIVLGVSPENSGESFDIKLKRRLPEVEFDVVTAANPPAAL